MLKLSDKIVISEPFYPCIKYKIPADLELDGTDYFIVAESMHWQFTRFYGASHSLSSGSLNCSLSFTCENDQKAFYKLIKDCLRIIIINNRSAGYVNTSVIDRY